MIFSLVIIGSAAIRVATQWYQRHLGSAVRVLLITNDRENKRKAKEEGILAETGFLESIFGICLLIWHIESHEIFCFVYFC